MYEKIKIYSSILINFFRILKKMQNFFLFLVFSNKIGKGTLISNQIYKILSIHSH